MLERPWARFMKTTHIGIVRRESYSWESGGHLITQVLNKKALGGEGSFSIRELGRMLWWLGRAPLAQPFLIYCNAGSYYVFCDTSPTDQELWDHL